MLWDRKTIGDKIVQIECDEFRNEKRGLSKLFEGMEENGFVQLTKVRFV